MADQNAPAPGCGVRALYRFYRQLRPTPAREALEVARHHERPEVLELFGIDTTRAPQKAKE